MPIQLDALEQAKSTLIDLAIKFGPKVIVALLIIAAGVYASRWVGAIFNKWLGKLTLDAERELVASTKQWLEEQSAALPVYAHYLSHWGDWQPPVD